MLERLFAPVQALYRWFDEHTGIRLAGGLALFSAAIVAPLPGWALDAWIVLALGSAVAMAGLLLLVGDELDPREALVGLPAFLRRFSFHRLALAVALTKAVLLGTGAGVAMEWLAQRGFGGSTGVALAAVAAIYAARFGVSHFPHHDRLAQAVSRLAGENESLDRGRASGRITPAQANRRRLALTEEIETLSDAQQIYRLLRADAAVGVVLALVLLSAGLMTGLVFKEWPLALTLSALTLYGLAEAAITALPGLAFGLTLSQWLGSGLEEVTEAARDEAQEVERPAPALLGLEVGREVAGPMRRAFPEVVAVIRTRLVRELGFALPRVELSGGATLPPRGYRLYVRGVLHMRGELAVGEGVDELAEALMDAGRCHAAVLLTLDATQAMLDGLAEEHPVAVAHALERHGLPAVHAVMQAMLRELVPIRDAAGLLEGLAALPAGAVPLLAERLRPRLTPALMQGLADERGMLRTLALAAEWEEALANPGDDVSLARDLAGACRETLDRAGARGTVKVALVAPRHHRARVAALLHGSLPGLAVIAPDELSARYDVRPVGIVDRRAEIPWKPPLSLLKVVGNS